jgi:hypothetical protein
MTPTEFELFLKFLHTKRSSMNDSEKLIAFIEWCKKKEMEEVIVRLSSETKGGWGNNLFLDFTTTRMIVSKKSFFRKFVDMGYIAGMAQLPYMLLSEKKDLSKIKTQSIIKPADILKDNSSNYSIWYTDIQEFVIRKGIETKVTNMLGTMIQSNFLTVKTIANMYDFKLPVNKNGNFEQIIYWLTVVLPVSVSTTE